MFHFYGGFTGGILFAFAIMAGMGQPIILKAMENQWAYCENWPTYLFGLLLMVGCLRKQ